MTLQAHFTVETAPSFRLNSDWTRLVVLKTGNHGYPIRRRSATVWPRGSRGPRVALRSKAEIADETSAARTSSPGASTVSRTAAFLHGAAPCLERPAAAYAALVGLTLLAFLAVLVWGGWVWDDLQYIYFNPRLLDGEGLRALWFDPGKPEHPFTEPLAERDVYWWPLLYTSFWLERWLWDGFSASGFHATNVAIHCVNACLVLALLRRFKVPGAWLAALVFAIHPGQMVAPALVMGRKELVACLCVLAALMAWFSPQHGRGAVTWWRVTAVCLLLVVGSLFKTQTVVIPAVLAVVHWWQGGRFTAAFWARLAPVATASALMAGVAWYLMAVVSSSTTFDFTVIERLLLAARSLWLHGWLSLALTDGALGFWRWEVSATDPLGWLALAGCALGLAALFLHAPRNRAPLAAALWFVVGLSPVLGLLDHHAMGVSFAFARHRYLSSIALIALVASYATVWLRARARPRERRLGWLVVTLFVAWCMVADWRYAVAFTKPSSWWKEMVRHEPDWDQVQSVLVASLALEGHYEQAIAIAQRNLDRVPGSLRFRWDIGYARSLAGNRLAAMKDYQLAVDTLLADPTLVKLDERLWRREHQFQSPLSKADAFYLHYSFGLLLSCAGRSADAAHQHRLAATLYPGVDFEQAFGSDDPHGC